MKWNIPVGEYTQVTMQRKNKLLWLECERGTDRYSFLSNAGKPFADFSLAEQFEHLLLDHTREQDAFIEPHQVFVREFLAFEADGLFCFSVFGHEGAKIRLKTVWYMLVDLTVMNY